MLSINIVAFGTIKETFFKNACAEYVKRISKFAKINIIELEEQNLGNESAGEIKRALETEAIMLEKQLKGNIVVLDRLGEKVSSKELSGYIEHISLKNSTITFVIGSSHGVSETIIKKAHKVMSFSSLTFPHQLFRVILLEQVYRAFSILHNLKYHK